MISSSSERTPRDKRVTPLVPGVKTSAANGATLVGVVSFPATSRVVWVV